jgi:hypothetical protein
VLLNQRLDGRFELLDGALADLTDFVCLPFLFADLLRGEPGFLFFAELDLEFILLVSKRLV